ncbi:MAG: hypothetical protein IKX59_10810 [Bacteroidales bacterium]|nr:hypothetical protein [Bacteroidales bacterium]
MVNTTQENPKTTSFVKAGHPYVTWLSEAVDILFFHDHQGLLSYVTVVNIQRFQY